MIESKVLQQNFLTRFGEGMITIDSHTQGEPTRLLLNPPPLPGSTIGEKLEYFKAHHDQLRRLLTWEPRGHAGMLGAVLTEPVSAKASFGLFYMDARRYPYLCGHATMGAVSSLIEAGLIDTPDNEVDILIDTPSGPLTAHAKVEAGRVSSVGIDMVPSFVFGIERPVEVNGFGRISVDLVYVGGYFAMVSADAVDLELIAQNSDRLIPLGMAIIEAANSQLKVSHPHRPEVKTIDVTEFYATDPVTGDGRSAVVYGESHLDRSPCGTGTTARMTLLHHQGKLAPGQPYTSRSPLETKFTGMITGETKIGDFSGITARVSGSAAVTGLHHFVVTAADPFPSGFLLL